MRKATSADRGRIVDILSSAFDDNKSVNYIVKQDGKRKWRIRRLMEYAFNVCHAFGKVFLSDENNACALILLPDKKRTTLRSVWWDNMLIFTCTGIGNLRKILSREAKIKALQPQQPMYYLWFIGVRADEQGRGAGSKLLKELIGDSKLESRCVCLETSTIKNISWYEQFGFVVYDRLDLGYELFFLKKE
ncbi:MAG: GNAT family N-acetyltransferase [Agriterribacter sp.]